MQHQQDFFYLSPSNTAMTENSFFNIRPYHNNKKQLPVLSKNRRGMRPMRSSTTSTAAQKNRKLRYYSTLPASKPAINISHMNNSLELGPKKGKYSILFGLIYFLFSNINNRFY
jgi:hypothetical protein